MTYIWILAVLVGAAGLTTRNAMQRHLTSRIGTVGSTQVRFLYGLPFSVMFLGASAYLSGNDIPALSTPMLAFTLIGALAQIIATALMLMTMKERSFSVTTAYTKTEPVQVALFGVAVLGDPLHFIAGMAILAATIGVILLATKPTDPGLRGGIRPVIYGIVSASFFAISSVAYRGGILALHDESFLMAASTTLATALTLQSLILLSYMAVFNRPALIGSLEVWRTSMLAGFVGALASEAWFIGFSLTSAANVRTLGLVEILFAQVITGKILKEKTSPREWAGMALVLIGVAVLLGFG